MNPAIRSASKGRLAGGIIFSLLYASCLFLLVTALLRPGATFQTIRSPLLIFSIAFVPLGLALFWSLAREAFWASTYFIFTMFLVDFFGLPWIIAVRQFSGRSFSPIGILTAVFFNIVVVQARKMRSVRVPALAGMVAGLFALPLWLVFDVLQTGKLIFAAAKDNPAMLGLLIPSAIQLLIAFTLLAFIWPRKDALHSLGLPIDVNQYPSLEKFLHQVCQIAGQKVPDRIYLSADANFGYVREGSWFGFGGTSSLQLGVPALALLTQQSVGSLVAHELGHSRYGHWSMHSRVYNELQSLEYVDHIVESEKGIAGFLLSFPIVRPLAPLMQDLLQSILIPLRRDFELEADQFAAETTGVTKTIQALRDLAAAKNALDAYRREIGDTPAADTLEAFCQYWSSPQGERHVRSQLTGLESFATGSSDRYPSLGDRIRAIEPLEPKAHEMSFNSEPAFRLLGKSAFELEDLYHRPPEMRMYLPSSMSASASSSLTSEPAAALLATGYDAGVRSKGRPRAGKRRQVWVAIVVFLLLGAPVFSVWFVETVSYVKTDSGPHTIYPIISLAQLDEHAAESLVPWQDYSDPAGLFSARLPAGFSQPVIISNSNAGSGSFQTATFNYRGDKLYFGRVQIVLYPIPSGSPQSVRDGVTSSLKKRLAKLGELSRLSAPATAVKFLEFQVFSSRTAQNAQPAGTATETVLIFETEKAFGLVILDSPLYAPNDGITNFADHFRIL